MRLTVVIDSAAGSAVSGRLVSLFVGDVGIDPAGFAPLLGELAEADRVRLEIPAGDPPPRGIVLTGRLASDTVRLDLMVLGRDTLPGEAPRLLVRVRR